MKFKAANFMGPLFVFLSDGSGKFEFFVFFIDPRVVIIQTKLNFLAFFLSFFISKGIRG